MQFSSRQHWMQRYHYTKTFYHSILSSPQSIVLQIADFGSARTLEHTGQKTEIVGTYAWMAPEVKELRISYVQYIQHMFQPMLIALQYPPKSEHNQDQQSKVRKWLREG